MATCTPDVHFSSEKIRVLGKVDLSRKGSVDEPISELVSYINSLSDFYTTSSCSGRLIIVQEVWKDA
jgi:tRNA wybutosine-synthesizing protein 3